MKFKVGKIDWIMLGYVKSECYIFVFFLKTRHTNYKVRGKKKCSIQQSQFNIFSFHHKNL